MLLSSSSFSPSTMLNTLSSYITGRSSSSSSSSRRHSSPSSSPSSSSSVAASKRRNQLLGWSLMFVTMCISTILWYDTNTNMISEKNYDYSSSSLPSTSSASLTADGRTSSMSMQSDSTYMSMTYRAASIIFTNIASSIPASLPSSSSSSSVCGPDRSRHRRSKRRRSDGQAQSYAEQYNVVEESNALAIVNQSAIVDDDDGIETPIMNTDAVDDGKLTTNAAIDDVKSNTNEQHSSTPNDFASPSSSSDDDDVPRQRRTPFTNDGSVCEHIPPADHALYTERAYTEGGIYAHPINATYSNARPPFYVQLSIEDHPVFLSCPPSRPVMSILHAAYGRVAGFDPITGAVRPLALTSAADACMADITSAVRNVCDGAMACCINQALMSNGDPCVQMAKAIVVTWKCYRAANDYVVGHYTLQQPATMDVLPMTSSQQNDVAADASTNDASKSCSVYPSLSPNEMFNAGTRSSSNGQGGGFMHQLCAMSVAIMCASIASCDVRVLGFYPDHNSHLMIPISSLIDVAAYSALLQSRGFQTNVRDASINPYAWTGKKGPQYAGWWTGIPMSSAAKIEAMTKHIRHSGSHQLMQHPFASWIFTEDNDRPAAAWRTNIVEGMPFAEPFVLAARALKKQLGLVDGEYVSVHFRMEADTAEYARRHAVTLEIFHARVYKAIEDMLMHTNPDKSTVIYLATGVKESFPYVQALKKIYPNVKLKDELMITCDDAAYHDTGDVARSPFLSLLRHLPFTPGVTPCSLHHDDHLSPNRELWAALDYLITRDSSTFIAWHGSMYSEMQHAVIGRKPQVWRVKVKEGVEREVTQRSEMIRMQMQ